jgi:hypothetical protein
MKKLITSIFTLLLLFSCSNEDIKPNLNSTGLLFEPKTNKVLLLKVDYTTNTFEGGKEFTFDSNTTTFSTNYEYIPASDFGSIKIFYTELNAQLFYGDIIWMGTGEIHFPTDFQPANSFEFVNTLVPIDLPTVENIFNPNNQIYDYTTPLNQVIYLSKVIDYRASNPNGVAKIFLYQPSVGIGDPATWKWIILFKN